MKFGISFPQAEAGTDVGFLRDFAVTAEELGYAFISAPEHVLQADAPEGTSFARHYSIDASFHEIMTTLAYWAAVTDRIELVASILVLPQRQAIVAAKQAAQIDLMSNGRLRLGVGLGWSKQEYDALGMDFGIRTRLMVEQIEVMRRLWTERLVDFTGEWHEIHGMGMYPNSVQKPIPVWIGAMKDPAIARAARVADGWFMNPRQGADNDAEAQIAHFRRTASESGRDPAALGIDATVFISEGDGPDGWLAVAERWRQMGATEVTFRTSESGLTEYQQHFDAMRAFAEAAGLK
jgi:probable F420-dependent oxidoreductase